MNEQERYARWLGWGSRLGFGMLVASFAIYLLGLLPAQVPIDELPRMWTLPADEFLARAGIPSGWGWLGLAGRGDVLNLAGIAILAGCSVPCLAAVIPAFRARRERAFAWICVAEIAVLLAAASGLIAIH